MFSGSQHKNVALNQVWQLCQRGDRMECRMQAISIFMKAVGMHAIHSIPNMLLPCKDYS